MKRDGLIKKATEARRESKYVDFKSCFSDSNEFWLGIIKDIVAMANTGGGIIIFGLNNDATPSECDVSSFFEDSTYDPAKFSDKIRKYTGTNFGDFEIIEIARDGQTLPCILIEGVSVPLIFTKEGKYRTEDSREKIEFQRGVLYFRHGAKSEPGTSEDMRNIIDSIFDRKIKKTRERWLKNIKKVVEAPLGSEVTVAPVGIGDSNREVQSVRLTEDQNAQEVIPNDELLRELYPYREMDIIAAFENGTGKKINPYDVRATRKCYESESRTSQYFFHTPPYKITIYSRAFLSHIIDEYNRDNSFFERMREKYKQLKNEGKVT